MTDRELLMGVAGVHEAQVRGQWAVLTDAPAAVSKIERLNGWTDVAVLCVLGAAGVISLLLSAHDMVRTIRWERTNARLAPAAP